MMVFVVLPLPSPLYFLGSPLLALLSRRRLLRQLNSPKAGTPSTFKRDPEHCWVWPPPTSLPENNDDQTNTKQNPKPSPAPKPSLLGHAALCPSPEFGDTSHPHPPVSSTWRVDSRGVPLGLPGWRPIPDSQQLHPLSVPVLSSGVVGEDSVCNRGSGVGVGAGANFLAYGARSGCWVVPCVSLPGLWCSLSPA